MSRDMRRSGRMKYGERGWPIENWKERTERVARQYLAVIDSHPCTARNKGGRAHHVPFSEVSEMYQTRVGRI